MLRAMSAEPIPSWFLHLDEEDRQFIKRLILASGSLKELAQGYGVSYPTIRLRLDRLIERVKTLDTAEADDAFQAKIRLLVASGDLSPKIARELLKLHADACDGGRHG
ncbi:MAG: DUF2089 family protein [Gammaproteobacteria bacterium]|nr:DUF2089 family protein [Gammaproteobacteria bacterium]